MSDDATARSLSLTCHDCGAKFTSPNWRLRCPKCVTAAIEAMRAAVWEDDNAQS